MTLVWRSLLYVPANNQRFIDKAHTRGADAIILDLEDSVPATERDRARSMLADSVSKAGQNGADVLVRINRPEADATADLEAAVIPGVTALLLFVICGYPFAGFVQSRRRCGPHRAPQRGAKDRLPYQPAAPDWAVILTMVMAKNSTASAPRISASTLLRLRWRAR